MITWVLFLGIGLVVGIIAGLYFARLDDVSNKQKKALQQKLESAEQQLKAYQSQVTEHFLKTASLVNSMTDSYRAVHEHLALGARALCDNQVNVGQLEMPTTKLLDNVTAQDAAKEKPAMTPDAQVQEKEAKTTTEQQPGEQQAAVAQKLKPHSDEAEAKARKPDSLKGKEAVDTQPAEQAAQSKEEVETVQPPATPESLHVDDSETETGAQKSLKDSEKTAPANVSRMVH